MHPTIKVLLCTQDPVTELSLRSFADNHPDVSGVLLIDSWTEVLAHANRFEILFIDADLIPNPESLNRIAAGVSVILLVSDTNDCRRYRGTRIRSCLLTPVSWESFQWTIRSVQPLYAAETA